MGMVPRPGGRNAPCVELQNFENDNGNTPQGNTRSNNNRLSTFEHAILQDTLGLFGDPESM